MIKVLQVTGAMNRGGAEVMIMDIFRNISPEVHFDFLINYNKKSGIVKGDFDEEIREKGAGLFHIPTQWSIGPSKFYQEFKIIVEVAKPDIVHIHMNSKSGIIAWAAKKAGVKHVITHVHADIKFRGSFIYRSISNAEMRFQKILINKFSDQFWGCSIEASNSLYFSTKFNQHNSAVINNAVDTKAYQEVKREDITILRNTYQLNDKAFVVGNVGRIVRHKNVLFIIDVLKALIDQGLDCKFVFAGRADQQQYLKEIEDKVALLQLQDRIIYLGLRTDIPAVMSSFDVFVGPALKEGFGLVAVEAQAAGVPCVLYTGFPKSVDMELNLVTFLDEFSVAEWVEAIVKMKEGRQESKEKIKNKIIELGFDSQANTKQIEARYVTMLKGNS
jgi:glycosyltransferase EpsF